MIPTAALSERSSAHTPRTVSLRASGREERAAPPFSRPSHTGSVRLSAAASPMRAIPASSRYAVRQPSSAVAPASSMAPPLLKR